MKLKLISALEKCFLDEKIDSKMEYKQGSCLKNEIFRFGCCYTLAWPCYNKETYILEIKSPIAKYVNVRRVENVPVQMAVTGSCSDEDFLRKTPGLYPDILLPIGKNKRIDFSANLSSLFIEVDTRGEVDAGVYPIELAFTKPGTDEIIGSEVFTLEILDAMLPEQELKFTQWFYADCLVDYYRTKAFSKEHWRIIENFMATAARNGINMILTPVFTPALDTYVGGERTTVQLVDIIYENGKYSFDFEKLGHWIELTKKVGIKYLEISHFFTQWGANHAPKIVATVNGKRKKIFGWKTEATGEKYVGFLNAFIPELIKYLKSQGVDKNTVFHISDEPSMQHLESYKKARNVVKPLVEDYTIIDALSNYEFYEQGIVDNPIPANNHIGPFIEHKVPNLWTYYCIGQSEKVSNRFISMPSYRNRIIGIQMYKYDIKGFLHWGYNFYNSQYSYGKINPYLTTDNDYFSPGGDASQVYPAPDGTAYESLRICVFHDAIQDMRALKLCEEFYGKDYVINLIDEDIEPITFSEYPRNDKYILGLREKINKAIKDKLS